MGAGGVGNFVVTGVRSGIGVRIEFALRVEQEGEDHAASGVVSTDKGVGAHEVGEASVFTECEVHGEGKGFGEMAGEAEALACFQGSFVLWSSKGIGEGFGGIEVGEVFSESEGFVVSITEGEAVGDLSLIHISEPTRPY